MHSRARWWTIKSMVNLVASATRCVKVCRSANITQYFLNLIASQFADVWLGYGPQPLFYPESSHRVIISDQMCSLVYSFSNLYFLGCFCTRFASGGFSSLVSSAYDPHAQEAWSTCSVSQNLQWYYLLGMLPFMVRFLQCLRQYHDSKLPTHLVNVRCLYRLRTLIIIIAFRLGSTQWQ